MLNLDLNLLEVITLFPEFIIYHGIFKDEYSGGIFKDEYSELQLLSPSSLNIP